jgi:hypothetical protein
MELYFTKKDNGGKNDICDVKIGDIDLPKDVLISLNGNKMIAQSQILDGVAVFERVTRKPFDIDFDFTMRSQKQTSFGVTINKTNLHLPTTGLWTFPLQEVTALYQNVWKKDEVMKVVNTFLNSLDIHQVIIQDVQITTIRGSVDVGIKLKTIEDFYSTKSQGTTLLI